MQARAAVRGEIDRFRAKVLQQEGHTPERSAGQALRDRTACNVFLYQDDSVEGGVQPLGRGQRLVQQFGRRHLALRHQMGKSGGVGTVISVGHRGPLLSGGMVARAGGASLFNSAALWSESVCRSVHVGS